MLNSYLTCTRFIHAEYAAIILTTFLIGIHFQNNAFFLVKPIHYHLFGYGMQIVIIRTFLCFVRKVPLANIATLSYHFIMTIRTEIPLLAYFIGIVDVNDVIIYIKSKVLVSLRMLHQYTPSFSLITPILLSVSSDFVISIWLKFGFPTCICPLEKTYKNAFFSVFL